MASSVDMPIRKVPPSQRSLVVHHVGDRIFRFLTLLMALSVFALIILIGFELAKGSHLALVKFGWHFVTSSDWDPVNENFGAMPFIFGTLVSSCIALVIAVP